MIASGNEIQVPGEQLLPGHVRDSNKTTLTMLLKDKVLSGYPCSVSINHFLLPCKALSFYPFQGFGVVDAGIARDDLSELTGKLRSALGQADLLVTTGGVSMGDRDLLRQVVIRMLGSFTE